MLSSETKAVGGRGVDGDHRSTTIIGRRDNEGRKEECMCKLEGRTGLEVARRRTLLQWVSDEAKAVGGRGVDGDQQRTTTIRRRDN